MMRKAQALGIPVTIHSAGSPAHPLEIGVLAEAFPEVPVIMDQWIIWATETTWGQL